MLHPNQFEVNDAWIVLRLNSVPIRTEQDGDFNCIALMDAASCFILGTDLVPSTTPEPSELQFRRLLRTAKAHKHQLPTTLFISRDDVADLMTQEATRQGIDVVRAAESELLIFTDEARQGFTEQFEEGAP